MTGSTCWLCRYLISLDEIKDCLSGGAADSCKFLEDSSSFEKHSADNDQKTNQVVVEEAKIRHYGISHLLQQDQTKVKRCSSLRNVRFRGSSMRRSMALFDPSER